jgi:hypothetical protein
MKEMEALDIISMEEMATTIMAKRVTTTKARRTLARLFATTIASSDIMLGTIQKIITRKIMRMSNGSSGKPRPFNKATVNYISRSEAYEVADQGD